MSEPATRIVTLSVPGMNCAACLITVKKALVKVVGVAKVDVKKVTFDEKTKLPVVLAMVEKPDKDLLCAAP